jgi:hypothetical protein
MTQRPKLMLAMPHAWRQVGNPGFVYVHVYLYVYVYVHAFTFVFAIASTVALASPWATTDVTHSGHAPGSQDPDQPPFGPLAWPQRFGPSSTHAGSTTRPLTRI